MLQVKKLSVNAALPFRASPLSAGYDLSSAIETKVPARGKAMIPTTDLSIALPEGTYARNAPRSSLASKHSIDVAAGVIDADRDPVRVILFNHSDVDFELKVGDRVAQMIIKKILIPEVAEVDDFDSTVKGAGGFASAGVRKFMNE